VGQKSWNFWWVSGGQKKLKFDGTGVGKKSWNFWWVRGGAKKLKFLMGQEWGKKVEIFHGSGGGQKSWNFWWVRGGPKKLKFLMGPEWGKKVEIFDGSGVGKKSWNFLMGPGWAKKVEIFDGSGVGQNILNFWWVRGGQKNLINYNWLFTQKFKKIVSTLVQFSEVSPTRAGSHCQRTSHTKWRVLCKMQNFKFSTASPLENASLRNGRKFGEYDQRGHLRSALRHGWANF
jgi:hypothetical protein